MNNQRDNIIKELETMSKKEAIEKSFFKVRAYQKVINQLKNIESVTSMDDLQNVQGIGTKIREKIQEILATGKLKSAERARSGQKMQLYEPFLKIYGVGIAKAEELVNLHNIKTIDQLKSAVDSGRNVLNDKQKLGLQYYYDIQERIPRSEIEKHGKKVSKILKEIAPNVTMKVVGSYRRGADDSGDIDIIIKVPNKNTDISKLVDKIISNLKESNYIVAELSYGKRKFMGICQLNKNAKARRIDILFTTYQEYPFALLYFTGNFDINIALRKEAGEMGYTLNEYKLNPNRNKPEIELTSEKEIFNFLGYKFLQPKKRSIENLEKL